VPQNGLLREIPQKVQKLGAHRSLANAQLAASAREFCTRSEGRTFRLRKSIPFSLLRRL
jgi:hypothetical protein